MDINVEKFQKDYKRFCKSYHDCTGCPLNELNELASGCYNIDNLTEIIPVVQKWTEEHPAKTYLMDFKEKFPNSRVDDIAKSLCLKGYYGESAGLHPRDCKVNCTDCWNREMR